ncbi:MAG: hypothetical protein IJV72_07540 [Clostridia bacterium]|nr:hypothetical protein [Clostridia bacterium]
MKTHGAKKQNTAYLTEPPMECNVRAAQCCPAFLARKGALVCDRECWFCQYADFHLRNEVTLEVGICRYPKKVITGKPVR